MRIIHYMTYQLMNPRLHHRHHLAEVEAALRHAPQHRHYSLRLHLDITATHHNPFTAYKKN